MLSLIPTHSFMPSPSSGPGDMGSLKASTCPLRVFSSLIPLLTMLVLLFLFAGHSLPKRLVCLCHKPRDETVLHSLHHSLLLAPSAPYKVSREVCDVLPKPQFILRLSACVFQQVPPFRTLTSMFFSMALISVCGGEGVNCIELQHIYRKIQNLKCTAQLIFIK